MSYKAAELSQPSQFEIISAEPRNLEKYECLIRVAFSGVCGTDLAIYSGIYPVPMPLIPGHEFSGVVEKVGDKGRNALIGQNVTGEINNTCLAMGQEDLCAACRKNRPHHCSRRTVVGIISSPGSFAEKIIIPTANVHLLPDTLPLMGGVMIEPLAAALQTFEKSPLAPGDTVVVLGAGRLGSLIALVADRLGARVVAFCRSEETRRRVAILGLHVEVCRDEEEILTRANSFTHGAGADIVVEATGQSDMLALALRLVRPEGTVAIKSTPGAPARNLDLTKAVVDEITIQGSRCGPFDKAIRFAMKHQIDLAAMITDSFPLEEIDKAFARAGKGGKVVVAF